MFLPVVPALACVPLTAQNASVTESSAPTGFKIQSPRGLLVVLVVLLVGVGSRFLMSGGLGRTQGPDAAAPTTDAGKLDAWLKDANPRIHGSLQELRLAPELPWLVTHAVRAAGASEVEFHGLDLEWIPRELAVRDGLVARVRLPAPRVVGHGLLSGELAGRVQVFGEGMRVPDPVERLRSQVSRSLGELSVELERELPFARFELVLGTEASWEELGHARPAAESGVASQPGDDPSQVHEEAP